MFKLRAYQIEALNAIHESIKTKKISLLSAATGAGKTSIACKLINKYYHQYPARTFLIMAHKKGLLQQFYKTFLDITDIPATDIDFCCSGIKSKCNFGCRIILASVQTMANKIGKYPGADLVIIDETHRAGHEGGETQYQNILSTLREYKPNHRVLGITATVYRLNHGMIYGDKCRPGRVNFFPELTYKISYKRLAKEGFLMPLRGKTVASIEVLTELNGVKLSGGEYAMAAAGAMMGQHVESAVDAWEEFGSAHKKVAILACTIAHAELILLALQKRNYSAVIVHSKLNKTDCDKALNDWQYGEVMFCVSVNILIEGFDFPALSCLVMCRPTKSPVVWVQSIGRILRMFNGKNEALIIDMTGNINTFGLDLDNPLFTIPKSADGEGGECPTKVCPGTLKNGDACGSILHAAVVVCPECGYEFKQDDIDQSLGEMVDVDFKQMDKPEWYDVLTFTPEIYLSKSNKKLLRLNMEVDTGDYDKRKYVSVWCCFEDYYSGYAVEIGEEKWQDFSDEPYPSSVEEAEFLFDTLNSPARVKCSTNDDGYLEPEEFDFEYVPEGTGLPVITSDDVPF